MPRKGKAIEIESISVVPGLEWEQGFTVKGQKGSFLRLCKCSKTGLCG